MLENKRKYFSPEITLGHIVQGFVMVFTVCAIWFRMDTRITLLETKDTERHEDMKVMSLNQTAILHQLTVLQTIWDERFNRK